MAVRQLSYCTHCGMPLLDMPLGRAQRNFCQSCGYPLHDGPVHHKPHLVAAPSTRTPPPVAAPAPRERRAGAAVADFLLTGFAALLAWGLGWEVAVVLAGGAHGGHGVHSFLAWVLAAAVVAAYHPMFWAWNRATPGMQLLGIRLSREDGSRVSFGRCALRAVVMLGSLAAAGAGFLAACHDPRGRTWHDRVAGTLLTASPS